jgi:hypothetical protein
MLSKEKDNSVRKLSKISDKEKSSSGNALASNI